MKECLESTLSNLWIPIPPCLGIHTTTHKLTSQTQIIRSTEIYLTQKKTFSKVGITFPEGESENVSHNGPIQDGLRTLCTSQIMIGEPKCDEEIQSQRKATSLRPNSLIAKHLIVVALEFSTLGCSS